MEHNRRHASRLLALVLCHRPETVGIELDAEGWADVADLLAAFERHGRGMTREELVTIVQRDGEQRFEFSSNGERIRAR